MDLTPYLSALRDDLTTGAAVGDEQTRRVAAALASALEPSARLMLMNALSDLAVEVSAQLPDHTVEVLLDGKEVRVAVAGERGAPGAAPGSSTQQAGSHQAGPQQAGPQQAGSQQAGPQQAGQPADGGDISRMTLRLFEELKGKAEQAAAAQGVSLNSFVSQAVHSALHTGASRYRHGTDQHRGPGTGAERDFPNESPGGSAGSSLHGWVQG